MINFNTKVIIADVRLYFIGYNIDQLNLCQMTCYMMILCMTLIFTVILSYIIGYITAPMNLYLKTSNLKIGNSIVAEHKLHQ